LITDVLTCRCRHCGKNFPYLRSDAGATAECPDCGNTVLLPGNLQKLATRRKSRVLSVPGLILEIGGFLLLFWFPLGSIAGPFLIYIGFKQSYGLRCSNCEAPTTPGAARCSKCRSSFSSD
jgi:hypothetical protein